MKTTKNTALAIVPSTLLLGLTVAQTTDADSYTVQNGDLFFSIASQGLCCWFDICCSFDCTLD